MKPTTRVRDFFIPIKLKRDFDYSVRSYLPTDESLLSYSVTAYIFFIPVFKFTNAPKNK